MLTAPIAVVCGPRATEFTVFEELLLLFDIRGMFLMAVVLMGLETKFDKDFMGDCSKRVASAEEGAWNGVATGTIVGLGTDVDEVKDCTVVPIAFVVVGGVKRAG